MKIYEIDKEYVEFLRNRDQQIFKPKDHRKYIGIMKWVDDYPFFVPLTSAKEGVNYIEENGQKRLLRRDSEYIKNITVYGKNGQIKRYYGQMNFKGMIPVPNGCYNICDFSKEPSQGYRDVLKDELRFVRDNIKLIYNYHLEQTFSSYKQLFIERLECAKEWDLQKQFIHDLEKENITDELYTQILNDLQSGLKVEDVMYKLDLDYYEHKEKNFEI